MMETKITVEINGELAEKIRSIITHSGGTYESEREFIRDAIRCHVNLYSTVE